MHFQRLEDLRVDHDKTQQEIADILYCQREVYRRYEKGTREIPVWAVIQLAQYYQCSTDYILGLSDTKTPQPEAPARSGKRRFCSLPEGSSCPFRKNQAGPENS